MKIDIDKPINSSIFAELVPGDTFRYLGCDQLCLKIMTDGNRNTLNLNNNFLYHITDNTQVTIIPLKIVRDE